jgi:hypothetical protein
METTEMLTAILADQLRFLQALHEVVSDSEEPETIRVALSALTSSNAGIEYLRMNPIKI